ncbi:MAG TPA: GntR family transcriptional regulator [Bryobacteraceae bacterium]|nr:GntR family transcriptional regulator [Bryobacteraceae bacterium]
MRLPKYQQVIESLETAIANGKYKPGAKLPSESVLVKQFKTSRITIGRALRELQQKALIERRAGSGTYVRSSQLSEPSWLFGLLIPDLGETEIFEPICEGMVGLTAAKPYALLRGNTMSGTTSKEEQARQLCEQYVARAASGVFFAPLELTPAKDETNRQILAALETARIPVVLLDRGVPEYPHRSAQDLVSVDNRRAGYLAAEHLLKLGCKRIAFVAHPHSASTVEARIAGYREALFIYRGAMDRALVAYLNPADSSAVADLMGRAKPDAFVCANDRTAGLLMHSLIGLGHSVPRQVRLVGIDDVRYASLLPVPLTTVRQPCREIGEVAMAAMIERMMRPQLPAREILLDCKLVIRESCGANAG